MTKVRQYFYLAAGLVAGLLPILVVTGVIDPTQSDSVTKIILSVGSLIGAGAAGTAGTILAKQRADGTVGADPVSPLDQVINNIPVVVQNATDAVSQLEKMKQVAGDALGAIPVFGPEVQAILAGIKV